MHENGLHHIYRKLPLKRQIPWGDIVGGINYEQYLTDKAELWGVDRHEIFQAHLALYEWVLEEKKLALDVEDLCAYVECVHASPEARTIPLGLSELVFYMAETFGVTASKGSAT